MIGRRRAPDVGRACPQCDRPHADVLRLTARAVRYSCRSCGAVITLPTRERLRRPGPEPTADPLTAFMPPRMARWLRLRQPDEELTPDRVTLARWYAEFDNFVEQARTSPRARAAYDEVSDLDLDRLRGLPKFTKVLNALNGSFYDSGRALDRLGTDTELAAERVGHVKAWLAGPGRTAAWITAPGPMIDPPADEVRPLLEPGVLTGEHTHRLTRTLLPAAFGVRNGPAVRAIVARFSEERVREALGAYLADGTRPLREAVLAELDGAT